MCTPVRTAASNQSLLFQRCYPPQQERSLKYCPFVNYILTYIHTCIYIHQIHTSTLFKLHSLKYTYIHVPGQCSTKQQNISEPKSVHHPRQERLSQPVVSGGGSIWGARWVHQQQRNGSQGKILVNFALPRTIHKNGILIYIHTYIHTYIQYMFGFAFAFPH